MFMVCNEKLNYNYGFTEVWVQYRHSICKEMLILNTKAPSQCTSWQRRDISLHKAYTVCSVSIFFYDLTHAKNLIKLYLLFQRHVSAHMWKDLWGMLQKGGKFLIIEKSEMGVCPPRRRGSILGLKASREMSAQHFDFFRHDVFCWGTWWQRTQQMAAGNGPSIQEAKAGVLACEWRISWMTPSLTSTASVLSEQKFCSSAVIIQGTYFSDFLFP